MKKLFIILLIVNCSFPIVQTQWVQQTLPVNKPITGIKFVDSLKGWACTSRGTPADTGYILFTSNSGTNWLVRLAAYGISFTDLDVVNSNYIYASGNDLNISLYRMFYSSNSGNNWNSYIMVPNMTIFDIQFINKDSAWECGPSVGPDVRTTTDGGNTWTVRVNGINAQTDKIFFLNYDTGFCAAHSLFKTTNAGNNWVEVVSFTQAVQSIFFLNQNTGWLGVNLNRMYYTSNGGTNWIMQMMPNQGNNNIYDLYFFNDQTGFAGTGLNRIFKTTNGGTNWGYQIDTGGSYRLSILSSQIGWTCWIGDNIGIKKSTNGGGQIIYTGFVNNGTIIPRDFTLYQNFPNPFNPTTTIKLDLPKSTNISLIICDMLGRELYQIANEYLKAGSYSFTWDARKFASGIYFYRLKTEDYTETKRMVLIK
jgi:Secretion system C-terminal sorting domain/Photosynthesis system II assembly factor YCF48